MVWVTKFLSFHRILKRITKYILIAIRVVLYDHYFYTSYSKNLKEKVFLRFFWISELIQATWKTTTLYLVCQSCCSLFAVVKHWPGEKAQDFPWLRGLGTHLNEQAFLNSWVPVLAVPEVTSKHFFASFWIKLTCFKLHFFSVHHIKKW